MKKTRASMSMSFLSPPYDRTSHHGFLIGIGALAEYIFVGLEHSARIGDCGRREYI